MTAPRASELPDDWEPGDSGVTIDDSDMEPPTEEELGIQRTAAPRIKPRRETPRA